MADRAREPMPAIATAAPLARGVDAAWRAVGWFGLLLAVVGIIDGGLHWVPTAFSSPEWEFATVAMSFGSLPLVTMGLAALLGSFVARGVRWGITTMGVVMLLAALVVGAAYVLFLLDVPLALNASSGASEVTLRKAIIRTSVMGVGFGGGYLVAAIFALRQLATRRKKV